MKNDDPKADGGLDKVRALLSVITWVGPVVLGLTAGYGSAKYTAGSIEQRLITAEANAGRIERQVESIRADIQRQVDRNTERYITREELQAYLIGQTRALDQIQADVRALRNRSQ